MKQCTKEKSVWEHISWVCTISLVFLFMILLVNTVVSVVCKIDMVEGTPSLGYSAVVFLGVMTVCNCIDGLSGGKTDEMEVVR